MKKFLAAALIIVSLSGCAGYRIGPVKPQFLSGVKTIAVPTFTNNTYLPRVEVLMTDTVIKQLQQDGTFQIVNEHEADAILKAEVRAITRSPVRALSGNVLATTEFNLGVMVRYTLVGRDGRALVGPAQITGGTSFFVGNDVASDQRQALPLAAEDLAVRITSQLTEGW